MQAPMFSELLTWENRAGGELPRTAIDFLIRDNNLQNSITITGLNREFPTDLEIDFRNYPYTKLTGAGNLNGRVVHVITYEASQSAVRKIEEAGH